MKSKFKIEKQGITYTLFSYLGTVIGLFATAFIYPKNYEYYGIFKYVLAIAVFLTPFLTLGIGNAVIKFQNELNKSKINQLTNWGVLAIYSIGFSLILITCSLEFILKKEFNYWLSAIFLAVFLSHFNLFKNLLITVQKISLAALLEKIIPKLILVAVFIGLIYFQLNLQSGLILFIAGYLFLAFILSVQAKRKDLYSFQILKKTTLKKPIKHYCLYSVFSALGTVLAFKIDELFIAHFIDFEATGIYGTGLNLALTLSVPAVALFSLHSPTITLLLKKNKILKLKDIFQQTSLTLFIIIGALYGCVLLGIHDLLSLLPLKEELLLTVPVIQILGFNVWVDKSFSFNSELIGYSDYYKFNLKAILILAVTNSILNILFLGYWKWGIESAAWATLISLVLFNISKAIFIYRKFKIQAFTKQHIIAGFSLFLIFLFLYFGFNLENHFINFSLKIGLFLLSALGLSLYFKWIPPLNQFLKIN